MMWRGAILLGLALWAGGVVAQVDPFAFMPDGGRDSLARAFPDVADQKTALALARTVGEWQTALAAFDLTERQAATLAAYLSRIAPQQVTGEAAAEAAASLPRDGRDLALAQCQSCHSLFTGYLMQRRDWKGWRGIFASPFHSEIPMTEVERDIFADYSAINMPMRFADVPPEMRF